VTSADGAFEIVAERGERPRIVVEGLADRVEPRIDLGRLRCPPVRRGGRVVESDLGARDVVDQRGQPGAAVVPLSGFEADELVDQHRAAKVTAHPSQRGRGLSARDDMLQRRQ
jgi:hypothetical protein